MPSRSGAERPAPSGLRRLVDEEPAARGVGDGEAAARPGDRAVGARDELVGVVDAPVGLGAAADHQLALLEPHLPHRLRAGRAARGSGAGSCRRPRALGREPDDGAEPQVARRRRSRRGASQAVRPSRAAPSRAAGTSARAEHRADVDVERLADAVQQRRAAASRAARRRAGSRGSRRGQRADAELDAALPREDARPERRAAAERGVGARRAGSAAARGIADQVPTNSSIRDRHAERAAASEAGQPLGAEHLVAERRGLAELDRRRARPAPAPASAREHRAASARRRRAPPAPPGVWSAQAR